MENTPPTVPERRLTCTPEDVSQLTESDLNLRAQLAEVWGHKNGRIMVAKAAQEWSKRILGIPDDKG